jgi:small subunit ribosomal protein S8
LLNQVTSMTDPIADILTRIRNAYMARKSECLVPYSQFKEALSQTLEQSGFISGVAVEGEIPHKQLRLTLKYINGSPAVSKIMRASKPGRRHYVGVKHLETPLSGYGVAIVSTSKGVMTDKAARQANLGGELICRIY